MFDIVSARWFPCEIENEGRTRKDNGEGGPCSEVAASLSALNLSLLRRALAPLRMLELRCSCRGVLTGAIPPACHPLTPPEDASRSYHSCVSLIWKHLKAYSITRDGKMHSHGCRKHTLIGALLFWGGCLSSSALHHPACLIQGTEEDTDPKHGSLNANRSSAALSEKETSYRRGMRATSSRKSGRARSIAKFELGQSSRLNALFHLPLGTYFSLRRNYKNATLRQDS